MTPPKKGQAFEINTDEEVTWKHHLRFWCTGWRLRFVLAVLCIFAVLAWKGPQWYGQLKLERAKTLLAKSEEARARGDNAEGARLLGQATALLGRHPLTLRAVARYQSDRHDLSALTTYAELTAGSGATIEDKVAFAREAYRLAQPDKAKKVLAELFDSPSTMARADVMALKAQSLAVAGKWREALAVARQAAGSDTEGKNGDEELILAQVLLRLPVSFPEAGSAHREGVEQLGKLCVGNDSKALDAAALLVAAAHGEEAGSLFQGQNVGAWVDAISAHPMAGDALRIRAWDLRVASTPGMLREIMGEFQARYRDATKPLQLEAARWLNQRGEYGGALELAEPNKTDSEDWLMVFLDATAGTGHWGDVYSLLHDSKVRPLLPDALRKLFELRSQMEMHRPLDVDGAWRAIQLDLRHEAAVVQLYVAGYAQQIGFPAEAAQAYQRLLDNSKRNAAADQKMSRPQRLSCYVGLVRAAGGTTSTQELRSIISAFASEFPELDEVRNDLAYLDLLTQQNIEAACETAKELTCKRPEILAYRSTLALGELRMQRITAAAEVYQSWATDWSTAPDRFKAVRVAVLTAAGSVQSADALRDKIDRSQLRPEELKLAGFSQ